MSLFELFLIAVGLSMDAFAIAICKGLSMRDMNHKHALVIGLYFGGFQGLMPFIGYVLGVSFRKQSLLMTIGLPLFFSVLSAEI